MTNFIALLILTSTLTLQPQSAAAPPQDHSKHEEMEHRGNQGMGFDQQKITHHFLLRKDGGAIQVTANSADDKTSREEIHIHLHHVSQAFESRDFNIPMFIHDQTPPVVDTMTKLKDQIH